MCLCLVFVVIVPRGWWQRRTIDIKLCRFWTLICYYNSVLVPEVERRGRQNYSIIYLISVISEWGIVLLDAWHGKEMVMIINS